MSSRSTDVNLIVRARTEGEKAISALGDAIETLLNNANGGSADIAELGKTLASLDKAAATIVGSVDKAGAALDRQKTSITQNKAALGALVAQQQAASSALDRIQSTIVDRLLGGHDTTQQVAQLRALGEEQQRLGGQVDRLRESIRRQEAELTGAQSSLIQLSSTSRAISEGQAAAEAQIELTTQALREQAAAGERVTDVQRRINQITGVDRPNATGSAASVAQILATADAEYRVVEARAAEIAKLREQEAATTALAVAEERQRAFTASQGIGSDPRGAQARESARIFTEAAEAEDQMAREAAHLRAQLDPLATIQNRVNDQLARLHELAAAGKLSVTELAAAEAHLAREAEQARQALVVGGGKPSASLGLFGLKPYELQNLGYQVNDIITQLMSGTSLTQTLGQQGGQILQLFPRVTSLLVDALTNPAVLAGVATIGVLALSLKEAADQAARLRDFSTTLTFKADGGSYNAKDLTDQADALERMGAKATEATAAVKTFVDDGINPDAIAQFGRAALETSKILGVDLAQAAKDVGSAFTGGFDGIAKFDDKLNFLTASERDHIRELFAEGNAQAARTEALNAYTRQADAAAEKQRGPWGNAARSLGNAWDALIKYIADSVPIKATIYVLGELAGAVQAVGDAITSALGGSTGAGAPNQASKIAEVQNQIRSLQDDIDKYETAIKNKSRSRARCSACLMSRSASWRRHNPRSPRSKRARPIP
ncbi:hypothetical protein HL653_02605 [Sphingomonas sp. AP4-R1]|uniref:phage tail length tape measure family protein n=1 Tax=Sphingomonas sp. AP4-R1 TaxID=2735134 RepID=UPI0014936A74|nr:phage tail length tape measure family protein [Sphingomonas sp. AP4-R1]QJU56825.1 hypothetical protein HL653_02605 [Sphingomonas sp. AP4-R1]